jgi:hypothetical protein
MNNPTNPNKITAIIMIVLAFALIFIMGIAYQSYQNGQQAVKNGEIGAHNTEIIKNTINFLKNGSQETIRINNETNNILKRYNALIDIQQ